ncbi:TPA: type II toxin-antitoxin system HigB family toxin [Klebsiella pneumoniae]|uniref:type II toxin-antitoxin system HigB family toxin n=1 Tax=Klebsiella pneumoniae TaxID=573 RepID=UPI000B9B53F1|nr:type II toxin-antitoxin system HigB family toxin [Klebsiella pneumoniae]HDT1329919.1 type II toxin-antitoxin system HigB family toxin [Klebsiella pneumoniae subsp. pneumoniae]AVW78060.1 type II toxin-antitoxin system HigB family toxin [Klebsiella pneumoniae]MCM6710540.1 type II toxin-antitoxin system HigB family toxin [Klebsiella pneumoniae]MCX0260247.1 type II toxin-antitoxin system HigB family toxin [Klebsiella pneumoniae]MCX0282241.1 type II toxin-antitoxin system HigB family toxin [Kleb
MKVLNVEKLHSFSRKHNQAKGALDSWYDEVKRDEWKTSQDIRDRYNSVSFLHDNIVIFNIKGNNYRLVVEVIYQAGIVIIERVGTHAEYDRWRLK